jgi:hypothetical protein
MSAGVLATVCKYRMHVVVWTADTVAVAGMHASTRCNMSASNQGGIIVRTYIIRSARAV